MTAQKMFENLGYKLSVNDDKSIVYRNSSEMKQVLIYKKFKMYSVTFQDGAYTIITFSLHEAITTQLRELEWY